MKKIILVCLFLHIVFSASYLSAKTYSGHGIGFNYPDAYEVSVQEKKKSKRIKLKNGSNIIEVNIRPDRFDPDFAESLARSILDSLGKKYQVSELEVEKNKKIPLKVKGRQENVNIEALKYSYKLMFKKGKLNIRMRQTLYLFSYGKNGYIIQFARTTDDFSDMITVLSSFQFDEQDKAVVTESESPY